MTVRGRLSAFASGQRVILLATAVLFGFTAWTTATYPADYVTWPILWSALAALAAVTSLQAAWWPGRKRVAVAGAASIVAAIVRSLFIFSDVVRHGPEEPVRTSFLLASATWAFVALVLHALWVTSVLPWAAALRSK